MANALNAGGVFQNFYAGQDDAAAGQQRNALAQMQQQQFGMQKQQFDQGQQDRQKEQQLDGVRNDLASYLIARKQGGPKAARKVWAQLAPKYGRTPDDDPETIVPQFIQQNPGILGPQASDAVLKDFLAPAQGESYTLTPGSVRFGPGGQQIASVPAQPQRPLASDNAVVPVADPTSPTGFKYSRRSEAAGQPAPAPRAQTSGRFSAKELQQARDKIRVLGVAKQQLANLKAQRDKIKDSFASGPGMGTLTPLSEAGSNFDASVDQMRDTITGLTRTPGVGAMSDFETRLSQAKLPSRNEFESSRDQKIQGLEDFINNLEAGYLDLLEDGQQPAGGAAPSAVDPQDLMDAADAILNSGE